MRSVVDSRIKPIAEALSGWKAIIMQRSLTMRDENVDRSCSVVFESLCGKSEGRPSVDHVVHKDCNFSTNVSDEKLHHLGRILPRAEAFPMNEREVDAKLVGNRSDTAWSKEDQLWVEMLCRLTDRFAPPASGLTMIPFLQPSISILI
jgi:hypothetical protein